MKRFSFLTKALQKRPREIFRNIHKTKQALAASLFIGGGILLGGLGFLYTNIAEGLFRSVSGGVQLVPICRVAEVSNQIGLSFDVAWGDDQTESILSLLEIYQVRATFFVTNSWMEEYPDLVKKIDSAGHELALHSATHPYFSDLSKDGMKKELTENAQMIQTLTGQQGKLFRPPFGDYNNNVLAVADSLGFVTVGWAVDGGDWQSISARKITKNILEKAKPGDIVMLQNNNPQTVIALKEILNTWQQQQYLPVPLGSLLLTDGYFVDYDGVQKGSSAGESQS